MIKLKAPLNYKGTLHEAGAVISVAPEFGDKLVKAGLAEQCITGSETVPKEEKDNVLKQLKNAQHEKEKAETNARVFEQELRQAQEDIKTLNDTLEKEREQSAGKVSELEKALADAEKRLEAQASAKPSKKGDG